MEKSVKIHKYKLDGSYKSVINNVLSKVALSYSKFLEECDHVQGSVYLDSDVLVSCNFNTYSKICRESWAITGNVPHMDSGSRFKIKGHSNDPHSSSINCISNLLRFRTIGEESIPDDEFYVYINVERVC